MITTVFLLFSQNLHKLKDFIYNNGIFILLQLDILMCIWNKFVLVITSLGYTS